MGAVPLLFLLVLSGSIAAQSRIELDSLKNSLQSDQSIEIRTKAGLRYADLIFPQSNDSARWAIDYVIRDCEAANYPLGIAKAKTLNAWFLMGQVNHEAALRSAHQALAILEKGPIDSMELAKTINMLGMINLEYGRLKEAESYMEKALGIILLIGDTLRIDRAYNNLGVLCTRLNQPQKAIDYYKRSRKLRVLLKDERRVAYSDFNLGSAYLQLNDLETAGFYFDRSVEGFLKRTSSGKVPDLVHLGLGEYYVAASDYDRAIHHINLGLNTSIESGLTDRWIMGYDLLARAQFKSGKTETAYATLTRRVKVADSLKEINDARAIAEMDARYKSASTEKQLMQSLAENLEQENKMLTMRIYYWSFSIGALILIVGLLILVWSRGQKKKVSEARMQKELAATKLTALRSQMNAHFIFNCINTAQHFVLNAQKEASYSYLSKFAQLLRGVLEHSSLNFVPLEDELNLIKNYLEIESVRFNDQFSYELVVDEPLKNEVFEIPSMIIQPFVENALIHGLLNLEDRSGQLTIELSLWDQQILCTVMDNGVGRAKATEIKARKQKHYTSQAFSNVQKRLELFHQKGSEAMHFKVQDLFDENQQPTGTLVAIWLPYH